MLAKCNIKFKSRAKWPNKKWWLKNNIKVDNFKRKLEFKEAKSWEDLKLTIKDTSDKVIGKYSFEPRKLWMTQEILSLLKKGTSGKIGTIKNVLLFIKLI